MKKFNVTDVLSVILIALILFSIFNTNRLTNEIDELKLQMHLQKNDIFYQLRGLESVLYELKEADKWYIETTTPKILMLNNSPQLKMEIQLLDYVKDSTVHYHVKGLESDIFEAYEAHDKGDGLFELLVPDIHFIEPVIDFYVQHSNASDLAIQEFNYLNNDSTLQYYITVDSGNQVKASDRLQISTHDMMFPLFQFISGSFQIDVDNRTINTLLNSNVYDPNEMFYAIDEVTIQAYLDHKKVQSWVMEATQIENHLLQYNDTLEITEEYDSLYIEVNYVGEDPLVRFISRRLIIHTN